MKPAMNAPTTVTPAAIPPLDFGAFTTGTEEKRGGVEKAGEEDDGFDDFDDFVGAPSSEAEKQNDINGAQS